MEEKKNNKGLIIGIIIFLIICLILIFYFMFKMVYKEPSNNSSSETSNTETNSNEENDSVVFTELTKYELKDGEEKEVTIDGKKQTFKYQNSKIYFKNKEIESSSHYLYVTNQFIIFVDIGGQFGGEHYGFYNFDGNKIDLDKDKEIIFDDLRIENGKLLADGKIIKYLFDSISIGNLMIEHCDEKDKDNYKKLSDYPDVIKEYQNEITGATYSFIYQNNKINLNIEKVNSDLNNILSNAKEVCVSEIKN